MSIESYGDSVRLEVVHSVYKTTMQYEKLAEGELYPTQKEKLVKQIKVRKWFKKEGITSVEEYVTLKNHISKKRSIVFDKYSGKFYATFHHPDEILSSIEIPTHKSPIGFTYDTKIHSAGPQIHQHKKRR